MHFKKIILSFLLLTLLSACAVGNRVSYTHDLAFSPLVPRSQSVVLVVQDTRPGVLSGSDSETNVGIMRSLAGVPWAIHTESAHPLAHDISESLGRNFHRNGYTTTTLLAAPSDSPENIAKKAKEISRNGNEKIFHFLLRQWETESWMSTKLTYCVELLVKSISGVSLASKSDCGIEALESSNPSFSNLASAENTVFGRIINSPEILQAFKSDVVALSPTEPSELPNSPQSLKQREASDAEERLATLKKMRDGGVITEAEYQRKRKGIIDGL